MSQSPVRRPAGYGAIPAERIAEGLRRCFDDG
jgi:hypothetical protein